MELGRIMFFLLVSSFVLASAERECPYPKCLDYIDPVRLLMMSCSKVYTVYNCTKTLEFHNPACIKLYADEKFPLGHRISLWTTFLTKHPNCNLTKENKLMASSNNADGLTSFVALCLALIALPTFLNNIQV